MQENRVWYWDVEVSEVLLPKTLFSLVQPHFDNCNYVWESCSATHDNEFQKLQNRAAHILIYSLEL